MIEIKATAQEDGTAYEANMNGRGDDILREAVSIVKGLYEGFKNDTEMQEAFLAMTAAYIIKELKEKNTEFDKMEKKYKGGESFA